MTVVPDKFSRKKPKRAKRIGRMPAKVSKTRVRAAKAGVSAEDAAARKKIGKTLDMSAFMAEFRKNTSAAAYWAQEE